MSLSWSVRVSRVIRIRPALHRCLHILLAGIYITLAGCLAPPAPPSPTVLPSPPPPVTAAATLSPRADQAVPTAATAAPATATGVADDTPTTVVGTWIGGYQLADGSLKEPLISIRFSENAGRLEGQVEISLSGVQEPLSAVTLEAGVLHFEWVPGDTGAAGVAIFDGQISGQTLAGTMQRDGKPGTFTLVHSTELAPTDYALFAGTYRFPSGRAIGFYQTSGPQSRVFATILLYADLQTGELGAVFPLTGTRFAVGAAVGLAYPFRAEVTFLRDAGGAVSGLQWNHEGATETVAQRVRFQAEDVHYPGAEATPLTGRLVLPRTPGRHPAVVIVHGAGKVTRQNWLTDLLSDLFALNGIATLSYDKRGVGDSGGVYAGGTASPPLIELLGQDALAGVAYLKSRPEIDPAQIGLQGSSQAGWIIPFAAAQSKDVAFMVLWSGPAVTQGISDLYDRQAETTAPDTLAQTLRDTPPSGFDPIPYLEQVTVPGFWAFGGRDLTVPVPESIANLAKVQATEPKDFTWQTFPGADHYLFAVGSAQSDDLRFSPGFATGLLDAMTRWLRQYIHAN